MISDIEVVNDSIKVWSSKTNEHFHFTLTNPEDVIKIILERDSEFNWWEWESLSQEQSNEKWSEHVCTVQTYDGTPGSARDYIPVDIEPRIVNVTSYGGGCMAPFITVTLDQSGQPGDIDTGWAVGGLWRTTLTPILIGWNVTFGMQTTCSYDGQATFKWKTEI